MEGIKLLDGDARVVQSLEPWSPPIEPIGVEQYIMEGIVAPVVVIDLLDPSPPQVDADVQVVMVVARQDSSNLVSDACIPI